LHEQEQAFLATLRRTPADDVTRLVYADWLDEQGGDTNTAKSAFLRLECTFATLLKDSHDYGAMLERLHELAKSLDTGWLSIVSKIPIEQCELKFEFQCPKQWDRLRPTEHDGVRFCETCQKDVFYCDSVRMARAHASQGHCVAVQLGLPRQQGDLAIRHLLLGKVSPVESPDYRGHRARGRRRQ
jgi:uncharacterized protein (TIGR02996 family)